MEREKNNGLRRFNKNEKVISEWKFAKGKMWNCGKLFSKKKKRFFILKLSKIKNKNLAKTKNTKNHLKKRKKLKKSEFFLIFVKKIII